MSGNPIPWGTQPYSIKRHGVTITNCDTEPVQTPGCIQGHGVLLALRPDSLVIAQASENTLAVLGHKAAALIGRSVGAVVGDHGETQLRAFVAVEPVACNPLYVFSINAPDGRRLDATVHANGGMLLLEFEATGRGDAVAVEPDYYQLVRKTIVRMQAARSLQEFCDITVDEIRTLTGLDRVMVYRFHADGHGEVFAESARGGLAPWLGLHYPAGDIPAPAREVFKRIWLRPTPHVGADLAEMVPLVDPASDVPLDMTFCALRGASVMYTEYLQNMKVTAGMTMPIRDGADLWGLIACHHYAGPKHVPWPVRAACEFIAQVASLQYRAAEDREHAQARARLDGVHRQLVTLAAQGGWLGDLADGVPGLLDAVDCGGAALFFDGHWSRAGATPSEAELDALATWLTQRPEFQDASSPAVATDHLASLYPLGAPFADVASGLLAVPLSRAERSMVLWFRPETMKTIPWAGHPDDKPMVPGPHGLRLTPRASFELYVESVRGRSTPWLPMELEAIGRLRVLMLEGVVERAQELARLNADLARSNQELDAFAYVASHDLKEPLRGIHKYAHQLLEGAPDGDTEQRRKLDALTRLVLRMDGLLDSLLHFSRVGRLALEPQPCDLHLVATEALEMVGSRSDGAQLEISVPRPLPVVQGDWVRCREIYANLFSNALKYNDQPRPVVEIGWIGPGEPHPRSGFPPAAAGTPIHYVRDNGIGIAPRNHDKVFTMFKRLHARDAYGGGSGAGLTIVKKLVERHAGQVWLDSEPGAGATFYFTLPLDRSQ